MRNGLYIDLTAVAETQPNKKPGVWSCKNEHQYRTKDLYPLRETLFEGVMTKVPYAYVRVLSEEYQERALVTTEYEGHRWNATTMLWVKKTREDMKQDDLRWEDTQRKKQAEKARKKAAKEAAKSLKAQGVKAVAQVKPDNNNNLHGSQTASQADEDLPGKPEKESIRKMRRAAVTEELVAELATEERARLRKNRRRERQDVL